MSYSEAMNLAMNGNIFQGIVDAMKRELLRAERSGDFGYINQIKVNIAVSLMQLAARTYYPKMYMQMYFESEKYLLSVLSVDPGHELANSNLASVRRNRDYRDPKDEIQPSEPPKVPLEKQQRSGGSAPEKKHAASGLASQCGSEGQCNGIFGKRWLTIGIPTVPRRGDPDYLNQTINAITKQLPTRPDDPLYGRVLVVILNNLPGQHTLFDDVRRRIESGPHRSYFRFEEAEIPTHDGINNPENHVWIPGMRVRRQTRAVVELMRRSEGLAGHFMFMEDDFLLCPHALRTLAYVTSKAHAYFPDDGWSGIRVSYGLCGILLMDRDVGAVADYLWQHQARRYPDHLLPEFLGSETDEARDYLAGRRNLAYRFNLMRHIGNISTIRGYDQVGFSGCHEELITWPGGHLGMNEAWKPLPQCLSDDLWPCVRPESWPAAFPMHNVASKPAQVPGTGPAGAAAGPTFVDPHQEYPL